jgi:hypothetical protein
MIAIGLGLRDRGHDIVFATVKYYRHIVESLGFEFHSIGPDAISPEDKETIALIMDLQKGTERRLGWWHSIMHLIPKSFPALVRSSIRVALGQRLRHCDRVVRR